MGKEQPSRIAKPRFKKPNLFVYLILLIGSWILSLVFRARITDRKALKQVRAIKGPVLALGTHHAATDFLYMTRVLAPKRMSFVIAANMFYDKRYAWAINMMRNAIPKKQFTADYECVRSIKKMVECGISIGLYPEGRVSVDGTQSFVSVSIAKLIKFLNIPVVFVKNLGGYLSMPRYNFKFHTGKVEITAKQLLTPEEIKTMSWQQIYALLLEEFRYNEFAYQEKNHIAFLGKRPALGLDRLLYKCPKCGAEFKMEAALDTLRCGACGNTATIDKYGKITPVGDGVAYPRVDLWYKYQKEALDKEIEADDNYSLTCEVGLALSDETTGMFNSIERGTLTLTKQGYSYIGEAGRELKFTIAGTPSIAFVVGTSIDFFMDNVIYRFCFDKVMMSTKYNIATELLHKKYFKEIS